jgi:hypothetical protein
LLRIATIDILTKREDGNGVLFKKLKDLLSLKFVRILMIGIEFKGINCIFMMKPSTENLHVGIERNRFQAIQFLVALFTTDEKAHIVVEQTAVHGDNLGQANVKFKQKIQSQFILPYTRYVSLNASIPVLHPI